MTAFERLQVPERWRGNYEEASRLEHRGCAGPALQALEDSQFELVPIKGALEALLSLETVYPSEQRVADKPRIESAVREILLAVGENPDRECLKGTPGRVAEAYEFLFSGLAEDPAAHLSVGFQEEHREMVLVRNIPFSSVCDHHLLPMVGKAHVGYVPNGRVVGLSKLARVVEVYSRRFQLQERLTAQIADALYERLGSCGSIAVAEAEHLCVSMRGVWKPGSTTVTSAVRGVYTTDERTRQEAMSLITGRG